MSDPKTIRCLTCRSEFSDDEVHGHNACPSCGSPGVPMSIAGDITVRINVHELRILTMWATGYASHLRNGGDDARAALRSVIRELGKQCPPGTLLTLNEEIAQLQEHFPDVEVHRPEPSGGEG